MNKLFRQGYLLAQDKINDDAVKAQELYDKADFEDRSMHNRGYIQACLDLGAVDSVVK